MTQRHPFLKFGGIVLLILGLISLIMGIVTAVQANQAMSLLGALGEGLGAEGAAMVGASLGAGIAGFAMIITIISAALYIITGCLGAFGKSVTACKVFGIIMLVLSIIGLIGGIGTIAINPVSFILTVVELIVIILYVVGAFKSVK